MWQMGKKLLVESEKNSKRTIAGGWKNGEETTIETEKRVGHVM